MSDRRLRVQAQVAATALVLISTLPNAEAAKLGALERQGRAILTRFCADCHAVGSTGRSKHPRAPAFRKIGDRYDIDDLIDQLTEGFTAPHPDMPTFTLSQDHVRAVRAYLHAIQN
jgi:cytochrome c